MLTIEQLKASPLKMSAGVFDGEICSAVDQNPAEANTYKVHLKARSRDAIKHGGANIFFYSAEEAATKPPVMLAHDFGTVRLPSKLTIDSEHGEVIGWCRPEITDWGIEALGVLTPDPANPNHPANKVVHNLKSGNPLQCSVDMSGGDYVVRRIPEKMTGRVNGKPVAGPAVVISDWPLKSIAICKLGADSRTEAELLSANKTATIREIEDMTEAKPIETLSATTETVEVKPAEAVAVATAEVKPAEVLAAKPTEPVEGVKPVEAAPVVTPTVEQLTATHASEIEKLKAETAKQIAELKADFESKLTAAKKLSVPGLPNGAEKFTPATWRQAFLHVKSQHPEWETLKVYQTASQQWPELRAAEMAAPLPIAK